MPRPITLFTGQFADLGFEELCRLAAEWGYEGLEIACWGDHFEVDKAVADEDYVLGRRDILDRHGLSVFAISCHLTGQAVCDHPIDERHRGHFHDDVRALRPIHLARRGLPATRRRTPTPAAVRSKVEAEAGVPRPPQHPEGIATAASVLAGPAGTPAQVS